MTHILIIDDDTELCSMVADYLLLEGFTSLSCHDGSQGVELACNTNFDAVILDVMLPSMNGFEVLRKVRNHSQTPVLMLTARGEDVDRIVGLEMGADDYLPKPFNPRELIARLRAILRRYQSSQFTQSKPSKDIAIGSLKIQPASRRASFNDKILELTSCEFNILEILADNLDEVVTKEFISEHALGKVLTRYDRSIDMHISHLRKKLDECITDNNNHAISIHTVRGLGYQLNTASTDK
jgi:DNA-binding response OmpR family regulator